MTTRDSRKYEKHDPSRTRWGFSGGEAVTAKAAATPEATAVDPETPAQVAITREILWRGIRALDKLVRTGRSRRDYDRFDQALEDGERILRLMKGAVPR